MIDLQQHPLLAPYLKDADHVDVKVVEGDLPLRAFIAGMLSYQPAWVTFLYRVRWVFVRLLGLTQTGIPPAQTLNPDDVSLTPGQNASFFTVTAAEDERYWLVETTESHLTAYLGVVVESLSDNRRRFHVITIVHYRSWAGPVYFNVIRPFHHWVVGRMVQVRAREPRDRVV